MHTRPARAAINGSVPDAACGLRRGGGLTGPSCLEPRSLPPNGRLTPSDPFDMTSRTVSCICHDPLTTMSARVSRILCRL